MKGLHPRPEFPLCIRFAWASLCAVFLFPGAAFAGGGFVDLTPLEITAQTLQHTVEYTVQVQNNGTAASGPFVVEIYIGTLDEPAMGDHGYPYIWVDSVGAGETQSVVCPMVNLPEGTYPTWAMIDSFNSIPETDETNNLVGPYGASVTPTSFSSLPDLFISSVTPTKQADGSIHYQIHAYNGGGSITNNYHLQSYFTLDEQPNFGTSPTAIHESDQMDHFFLTQDNGGWLAPGGTKIVNHFWESAPIDVHKSWILLDALAEVTEADEINNVYGPFIVDLTTPQPLPDLSISDVRPTVNGYTVTYEVDVHNGGGSPPGPFDIDIFPHLDETPNITGGTVYDVTYKNIATGPSPGETETYEVTWYDGYPGSLTTWVGVDAYQHLTETNEGNNFWGPVPISITEIAGSDIKIDAFEVEVIGGNAIYTVKLRNNGDLDTGSFEIHLFYHRDSTPELGIAGDLTKTVENLAPQGGTAEFTLQWTAVPQGTHQSWVVVDPFNNITETQEGNNVGGPVSIQIDEAVCPLDTFLTSACACGGVTVQSGYCCNGAWSALPCDVLTVDVDASSTDDAEETTSDGESLADGEDSGEDEEGPTVVDDGGCTNRNSPMTPPIVLLALVTLVILARTRRQQ